MTRPEGQTQDENASRAAATALSTSAAPQDTRHLKACGDGSSQFWAELWSGALQLSEASTAGRDARTHLPCGPAARLQALATFTRALLSQRHLSKASRCLAGVGVDDVGELAGGSRSAPPGAKPGHRWVPWGPSVHV